MSLDSFIARVEHSRELFLFHDPRPYFNTETFSNNGTYE